MAGKTAHLQLHLESSTVATAAAKSELIAVRLYIGSPIMEPHGGEIGLQCKFGEGRTFSIKLPIDGYRL